MSSEDQEHIGRVLSGDTSAFRFLVDKNKSIVYSIALRILGDPDDARDAAQESFIKAYHHLHTFEGKSKFSTWLYTITYRICVTRLKLNSSERLSDGELPESYSDRSNDPQEEMTEKENQILVREAIEKLPKIDALLIMLYYFDESSVSEIGEITGLTASNIKIKLFRARKMLEQDLKVLR